MFLFFCNKKININSSLRRRVMILCERLWIEWKCVCLNVITNVVLFLHFFSSHRRRRMSLCLSYMTKRQKKSELLDSPTVYVRAEENSLTLNFRSFSLSLSDFSKCKMYDNIFSEMTSVNIEQTWLLIKRTAVVAVVYMQNAQAQNFLCMYIHRTTVSVTFSCETTQYTSTLDGYMCLWKYYGYTCCRWIVK